jgi:hypothetical protein
MTGVLGISTAAGASPKAGRTPGGSPSSKEGAKGVTIDPSDPEIVLPGVGNPDPDANK